MAEKKKKIILFVLGLFLINLVYAAVPSFGSIPPIPDHFAGKVLIDNQNAPVGAQIEVYVDSVREFIYDITEQGKYDLYVTSGNYGDLIEFKILNKIAGSLTRQGGEVITLDLAITTITSNDGGSSGGGGSGGGGGGGSGGSSGTGQVTPSISQQTDNNINTSQNTETKTENNKDVSLLTGSSILNFVTSGEGIAVLAGLILVVLAGVILIKHKPPKWKRN